MDVRTAVTDGRGSVRFRGHRHSTRGLAHGLLGVALAGSLLLVASACTEDHAPPQRHAFRHTTLFVDPDSLAAQWQRAHQAAWLTPITSAPQARWLTGPADLAGLADAANAAASQHRLLVL